MVFWIFVFYYIFFSFFFFHFFPSVFYSALDEIVLFRIFKQSLDHTDAGQAITGRTELSCLLNDPEACDIINEDDEDIDVEVKAAAIRGHQVDTLSDLVPVLLQGIGL